MKTFSSHFRRTLPRRALAFAATASICFASTAAFAGGPGPQQAPALPDLTVGKDRLRSSLTIRNRNFPQGSCSVFEGCVGGTGSRRTLEFDTQIINQGTADATLGTPQQRPDLYVFSSCHGHYHMRDSLDYSMARGGVESIGLFDQQTGTFYLKNGNSSGFADYTFAYGAPASNLIAIMGDWDADGTSTPGLYNPQTGVFQLRNSQAGGNADVTFFYGAPNAGLKPIAGDWDGDGDDTVGLYNPATGVFMLRNTNAGGNADVTFFYGASGQNLVPVAGDWDGDDDDSIGLYNPATGLFQLRNTNDAGFANQTFLFGAPNLKPIAGDWDVSGADSVGVYNSQTGTYYLTNGFAGGNADATFLFGASNSQATPVAGDFDFDLGPALPLIGYKQAFCWLDSERLTGTNPSRYSCSNQGITAGWSDVYTRGLDCQWVDITGLAGGVYQFRVSVNDSHAIVTESDYSNNIVTMKIKISPSGSGQVFPKVNVTAPAGRQAYVVGQPVNVEWTVEKGQNVTHQELWLEYATKKTHAQGPADHSTLAQARLIDGNIPANARSYRWVPTEEFLIEGGRLVVRTQDDVNLVGSDARSKGRINVNSR